MKLTYHCQMIPGWMKDVLKPGMFVKVVGGYAEFPGVTTIVRPYWDQGDVDRIVSMGKDGADEWFGKMYHDLSLLPKGTYVEPTNEASIWVPEVLRGYAPFHQRLIPLIHGMGLKIIVGGINTGHPKLLHEDGGKQLSVIGDALKGEGLADGLSLHEYSDRPNDIMAPGQVLRYRDVRAGLKALNKPLVPFFITEFGFDRPRDGTHDGWKTLCDSTDVAVREYMRYAAEIEQDDYVVCATIFTAGPYINREKPKEWLDFEVTEEMACKIAASPLPKPDFRIIEACRAMPKNRDWRREWPNRAKGPIHTTVIHHSVTECPEDTPEAEMQHLKNIANGHIRVANWWTIGYHYAVFPSGRIYRLNPLICCTNHCGNHNSTTVGVCMIGKLHKHPPTDIQLRATSWLCKQLGYKVVPHKALNQTACPGHWEIWGSRI